MSYSGGRRRPALALSPASLAESSALPTTYGLSGVAAPCEDVILRYRGLGPFTMRSRRTGRLYACGGTGTMLKVDAADADFLVRTRIFRRVS